MTKEEAYYQSQVNKLGISIYPVVEYSKVVLEVGYHVDNDITKRVKKAIRGTIKYANKANAYEQPIRKLYKHLYNENLKINNN